MWKRADSVWNRSHFSRNPGAYDGWLCHSGWIAKGNEFYSPNKYHFELYLARNSLPKWCSLPLVYSYCSVGWKSILLHVPKNVWYCVCKCIVIIINNYASGITDHSSGSVITPDQSHLVKPLISAYCCSKSAHEADYDSLLTHSFYSAFVKKCKGQ